MQKLVVIYGRLTEHEAIIKIYPIELTAQALQKDVGN